MAPPKLGYPNWVTIKTQSFMRISQDTMTNRVNLNHPEGMVDMDAIPSPIIEPVIPTIVEEK